MANYLYLVMNLCVFLPLFLLSWRKVWGIHVDKAILSSYLLVSVPFIVWDVVVTKLGHWSFSARYTLGVNISTIPVEELFFFLTVPFACLYVWEALRKIKSKKLYASHISGMLAALLVAYGLLLAMFGGGYSRIAAVLLFVTVVILYSKGWLVRADFWQFQVVLYLLFIGFNSILTALPIVLYAESAITGARFITIPIEDFAYNFVLINGSLLVYEHFRSKS